MPDPEPGFHHPTTTAHHQIASRPRIDIRRVIPSCYTEYLKLVSAVLCPYIIPSNLYFSTSLVYRYLLHYTLVLYEVPFSTSAVLPRVIPSNTSSHVPIPRPGASIPQPGTLPFQSRIPATPPTVRGSPSGRHLRSRGSHGRRKDLPRRRSYSL